MSLSRDQNDFESQLISDQLSQTEKSGENSEQKERDDADHLLKEQIENRLRMDSLLSNMSDPTYGQTLQDTLKSLSQTSEGNETVDSLFAQLTQQFEHEVRPSYLPNGLNDKNGIAVADREVAETMKMIGSAQKVIIIIIIIIITIKSGGEYICRFVDQ